MSEPLKLIRRNTVPPGGWRYLQPETKIWIHGGHFDNLVANVVAHRNANHLPVGSDVAGEVEHQLCEPLGPEWCNNSRPKPSLLGVTFAALIQGTKTLVDWALSGGIQVAPEETERRAVICTSCEYNLGSQGCIGCNTQAITDLVASFAIKEPIPHEQSLKYCKICSCKLSLKVRVPLEILHRHTPDEQQQALPSFCWVKKPELKAA